MDLGNLPARFAPKDNPLRFRQGSIVSVEADQCTLTVTIAGSTVPVSGVRYATGVMPVPGLAVWLATDGRDLWAIATLMTTDTTPWGYYVDYTFARGATQPAAPTGNIPASPPWYGSPPSGTTPLWMSEATKNPQGVVVGSWSVPVQLTGAPGAAAPLLQVQYSQDGTNWYTTPTGADVYIRSSNDGGATWSAAVRILGPQGPGGATGPGGADGPQGPQGPGGSTGPTGYSAFIQYSSDDASWHDAPWNTGDNFQRSGTGTSYADITARSAWGPGVLFVGTNGADGTNGTNGWDGAAGTNGNYIAVAYKEGARTGISAPTGNGPVPSGWSGVPVALSDGVTNCLWVSRATCTYANVLIGSWSTPNQFIITADYLKAYVEIASPIITGGRFQTAATGPRVVMDDSYAGNRIALFSGSTHELSVGGYAAIYATTGGHGESGVTGRIIISSPSFDNGIGAVELSGERINLWSGYTYANGDLTVHGALVAGSITPLANWADLALYNSWVDYTTGVNPASMKDGCGIVHLRGLIKDGTAGTTICMLPEGSRPAVALVLLCPCGGPAMARVDIATSGAVSVNGYHSGGTNAYLSLDTISFPAA